MLTFIKKPHLMSGPTKHIAGIVLCGGQSSRMGRDKWALPWGDETLLQRTVRILSEVVNPIAVVAAAEQDVSGLPTDAILVRDLISAQGPLGGLHAGLQALAQVKGPPIEAAYVTACDTPLLKPEFVRAIIERLETHELAVAKEGGFHHPLAGVYRVSLIDRIEKLLRASRNRPLFLIEDSDSCEVEVEELRSIDPELDSLRNCNTPEEYEAVLKKFQPSLLSDTITGKHHSS
ncbi:MAG TPA: molybdenum cofactor guanylyltransferase [Planctomycetaceae bacterium]|nr:molybdenum cofactor guanylyltransferase [Planctomycetaceae bacterium]